jgi:sugar lactone lactonase YvrE
MIRRNRHLAVAATAIGVSALLAGPTTAAAGERSADPASAARPVFPSTIQLPDGFQPEGIAIGSGPVAYFGSLADGSVYRADLVTGVGSIISEGPGTPSVGMKLDRFDRLFISGGPAGDARVVDANSGDVLATYTFTTGDSFINDVVLTADAAYFTDSVNPFLYKLPLGRNGSLPAPDAVVDIPLTGDLVFTAGFNVNGIARTPDGQGLLVVQSNTGLLFRVDPVTGTTRTVDLGDALLTNGDGLLLAGHTLYAVQNVDNMVAVVRLNHAATRGTVVDHLTDPRFDVPTTVAAFGNSLYLPNARFTTPPTPDTPYSANAIRRR